jgi:hypothetical protein
MRISRLLIAAAIVCAFLAGYANPASRARCFRFGPDAALCATEDEAAASPQEEVKTFGKVRYFPGRHTIEFDGEINMRDSQGEPMELFACAPGGKTHESVVVADITPSDLHAALLEAGLMTYPYPDRVAADRQDLLGSRAIVWMVWENNGEEKRLRAEDCFTDTRLGVAVGRWGWAFVGQFETVVDKETGEKMRVYRPDSERSLITDYHSPNSVLDNPRSQGAFDDNYVSNTDVIPELKTKVTIVIEPTTEENIVAQNVKYAKELNDKLMNMRDGELPEKLEAARAMAQEGLKWLETLAPLAKEADKWNDTILHEIDPTIKAKTDKLAEAAKAGDKNAMAALNTELEKMYAEREVALKQLEKAYHYYYKSITEREAAEGKDVSVGTDKQAILDGDVAFYSNKEETVNNELALAELAVKKLEQNAALAAEQDPAKRAEIQVALAELDRDGKILENKIAVFHLKPEVASTQSYIATAEKNLADAKAKDDDELVASYQKELDGHNARLAYLNQMIEAKTIRQKTAELGCAVAVSKLKGQEPSADTAKQLEQLDAKASILEKRAQVYELGEGLKTVSDDLEIELQAGGDPDLIKQMQDKKKEIEDRIASLKAEIESLEKVAPPGE